MTRVALTGAAGGVGTRMRKLLQGRFDELVLSDLRAPDDLAPHERFIQADLAEIEQVEALTAEVDAVIHLGGLPYEFEWAQMLQANIIGTYNLYEAARRTGVKRVVFASSNQVVGFYPRNRRFSTDVPLRPSSRYGVTKAFGETIAALYADKHDIGSLCIRIGRVAPLPEDVRRLALWIKPEDLAQLMCIGIEHPDIHFDIVYGISENDRSWYDNSRAYELGYRPEGRAEEHFAHAFEQQKHVVPDPIADRYMGGKLCALEYSGSPERSGR